MERHELRELGKLGKLGKVKRPPEIGAMKRTADAQALTLRAQLRAVMRVREMTEADVAASARLDAQQLATFLAGASLSPRWQEKLARWLDGAIEG